MTENSFDKIKKLIKIIGGKVIIIEDGEPVFVVTDVNEYLHSDKVENSAIRPEKVKDENINKDIEIWKTRQNERKLKQFKVENDSQESDRKIDNEIVVEKL